MTSHPTSVLERPRQRRLSRERGLRRRLRPTCWGDADLQAAVQPGVKAVPLSQRGPGLSLTEQFLALSGLLTGLHPEHNPHLPLEGLCDHPGW